MSWMQGDQIQACLTWVWLFIHFHLLETGRFKPCPPSQSAGSRFVDLEIDPKIELLEIEFEIEFLIDDFLLSY